MIGCGSIGRRHIQNLLALGQDVWALDTSAEALASLPRAAHRVWHEPETAWMPTDFDALVIATPADRHLPLVEAAVMTRRPFFVEKPLGTVDQLPRWRELAALDLPVNQVGYHLRFHPDVWWLKDSITPIEYLNLTVRWDGRRYADPFLESSHELDLARLLLGDVRIEAVDRYDDGDVFMELTGGHAVIVNPASEPYFRMWHLQSPHRSASAHFESPAAVGAEAYRDELAHFLICVQRAVPTNVPLAEGLATLELCHQAMQWMPQPA